MRPLIYFLDSCFQVLVFASMFFLLKLYASGVSESIDDRTRQLRKIKDEKIKLKVVLLSGWSGGHKCLIQILSLSLVDAEYGR